jgi:hypothetical protein
MPSFQVAPVACMNAASSSPINWLNQWIVGIVASPTPIVPIASDSIRAMATPCPASALDSAAAVIHPAVPPPRIATERIGAALIAGRSRWRRVRPLEREVDRAPQLRGVGFVGIAAARQGLHLVATARHAP